MSREDLQPRPKNPESEEDIVNPIDPFLSTEKKVLRLQELSYENEKPVQQFIEEIDKEFGCKSKFNYKNPGRIAEKAARPSIKKKKPWFDVEHIRDGFRFKTVLKDIMVLPEIAKRLKASGFGIVKIDMDKLLDPGDWGWRIVVFDLRMPNRQLVEYYLPVQELEDAKNAGNHELFEKWRNRNLEELNQAEKAELFKDVTESDDRYEKAWQAYLKRTGQREEDIQECLERTKKILNQD